ncbi:MAG: peptide chain release factor 3 [Bacteriovoracaceae bacterium]
MEAEIKKRCTFAIISHPDAGKTTITEKLIWFGKVIHETGKVKSKTGNFAKSDWMELEKQRGISITSSVISFDYQERMMHLLDTPGHKDFSEDTYRTLTAVESVLMMIDSAKGVEEQTIKLMEVCRMRDTPIVTFMNKFDRDTMNPFALIDNLEKILSIQCVPLSWPIGSGVDFKGVYDLRSKKIISFKDSPDPFSPKVYDAVNLDNDEIVNFIGKNLVEQLKEDLIMIETVLPTFNQDEYLSGIQTPVFFGSALNNFGVKEVLDMIASSAPCPLPREAKLPPFDEHAPTKMVDPFQEKFSGFIFKIQANMDKKHRDRVSFMRVCSGKFERNQKIFHVRTEKEIRIAAPVMFQAQDREITEVAYAGDIVGLYDSGKYQIGDTFTEGELIKFTGIPNFAPELFMKVVLKDPMKAKHLEKGLWQLSEEGATQLFTRIVGNEKILGAVGRLQFDVVKFRLEDEYSVKGDFTALPFKGVRWVKFNSKEEQEKFQVENAMSILLDKENRLCFAFKTEWDLKLVKDKFPKVNFFMNSDYI